jgi:fatty-acyl-CoA synthase
MQFLETTLGNLLREKARSHPDQEFIIYADRNLRFTYGEFDRRVDELARGLLAIGLKRGDHIGIWATNVPDWNTVFFAAARAGMVLVTINTNYKLHELDYLMKQSDLACLFISDGFRDSDYLSMTYKLIPELNTCSGEHIDSAQFPCLRKVVYMGQRKHRGLYSLQELFLLGKHAPDTDLARAEAACENNDTVCMLYTSGTTGFPKGVMLTHRNIVNNGFHCGENQRFTQRDVVCLPIPLFHSFGLVTGMISVVTHGAAVALLEWFDPLLTLATIQKEKCTSIFGVPTMFIAMINHPMFSIFDLSSLHKGTMGGAPCPIETMKQIIDQMHLKEYLTGYGLTEASPEVTHTSRDDSLGVKMETVGRPAPGVEVTIRDVKTNEECPTGVHGEICCRGYNVMKGYYKMPEETARSIDPEGWLHTGDLGFKDENGNFKITGRIKDMIIRGGENIYPKEIEDYLYTMPGIKDVQVVGIPSKKYGEEVSAFVILHDGAAVTEEDVRDFCRGQISRFKIPKYVFFADAFPFTSSGKVQKFVLREMGLKKVKEAEIEIQEKD